MCDIRIVSIGQNITRSISQASSCANRSDRSVGWCAIFGFVTLGRKITRCISHVSSRSVRSVCDVRICNYLQENHKMYVARIESVCDVRICNSWPENHKMYVARIESIGRCAMFRFVTSFVALGQKRRFWKDEQKMTSGCSIDFSMVLSRNRVLTPLKSASKFIHSKRRILDGWTKDEIRMFEALFKGVSARFGLRIVEKSVETPDFIFCSSFQNLRLGA